ncbi:MAG: zinc ribbon domain-containing protein [Chloroflexi bacterium]|nr:zinc ribbon domain-containing protein [Chloroflexota bacterium]
MLNSPHQPVETGRPTLCPNCRHDNSNTARFCEQCAEPLTATTQPEHGDSKLSDALRYAGLSDDFIGRISEMGRLSPPSNRRRLDMGNSSC